MTVGGELLTVSNLSVDFPAREGVARVVDDVTFSVRRGEIVGVVGESGSGKSLTMLSVLRLIPPPGRIAAGSIVFDGRDLGALPSADMRRLRGNRITLIPADALASLNPVTRVGHQVMDIIEDHRPRAAGASRAVLEMLGRVGLSDPQRRARQYPHELSGGMQQRILIAMGLVNSAELVIADEPTSALDVTIQAQILRLLLHVRQEFGSAVLLVSHDLATVAEIADRVMVMYAGRLVEVGSVPNVFDRPRHPYSKGLIASIPPLGGEVPELLEAIPGTPPEPGRWPAGCRYAPRCGLRRALGNPVECETTSPALRVVDGAQLAACHFAERLHGGPSWRGSL